MTRLRALLGLLRRADARGEQARRHALAAATFLALGLWWTQAGYFGHEILSEIAAFAILCLALDLAAGYGGMVSLGHAALFGGGAYAYAALVLWFGCPPLLAAVSAPIVMAAAAALVAAIGRKAEGAFFIMLTLAFGQMGHQAIFATRSLGGDDGLSPPALDLTAVGLDLADGPSFSLFALTLAALTYVVLAALAASPYGRTLVALRENPDRMAALGLSPTARRVSCFAVSGAVAGLAGVLFALRPFILINPGLLDWTVSGEALLMVILGGLGSLAGAVLGAAAVVTLRYELSDLTDYWSLWLGLTLIAAMAYQRRGLVGLVEALAARAPEPAQDAAQTANKPEAADAPR